MRGLQARITDGIGRQIIGGVYQPGGLLPKEAELAVEFGVSRTSVREGMRVLAAKGLVDIRQKIGTKVRQPENWNLFDTEILRWHEEVGRGTEIGTDLAEVRELLEPAAARLASSRATAEDLRRIRAAIENMASPASDREGYAQAVADFHRSVCAASNNVFLQQFGSVVFDAMTPTRAAAQSTAAAPVPLRVETRARAAVLQAITVGDGDAASDAMLVLLRDRLN